MVVAAGCTAVIKPSEFTSSSTAILCEILEEAGLPPGVQPGRHAAGTSFAAPGWWWAGEEGPELLQMGSQGGNIIPNGATVGASGGSSTYNITINAAPGMDPKELVRLISAEMDRRERSQKSRVLSSMSDID